MKCQILLSGKTKKNSTNLSSAELEGTKGYTRLLFEPFHNFIYSIGRKKKNME